ncbi:type II secretion system minor pseudopilin GspK [Hydrogenophaga sp. NFH-34]|uniref:type II secretion system minor pseudopilin GspK n=1 Tax=Hydrogenophaga sp. NFH-34 TaxID=2744446 RepID=UPI001F16B145|nr:type II secretion system minor pseudopilin GspK [Hydrogenophaga sp. NFH-34]
MSASPLSPVSRHRHQRGAALLLAMLVVTLVASLSAASLWHQWKAVELESAERQRLQASLLLTGALDWARLILREDARGNRNSGNADHLGEPWATPLAEARLSSFLAADHNDTGDDLLPAFLSGDIQDLQSRLNFRNLVRTTGRGAQAQASLSEPDLAAFLRLYETLGLPEEELQAAVRRLLTSTRKALNDPEPSASPLIPQRFAQLEWLGISPRSLQRLAPHVMVLPQVTTLNLNTASPEALAASVPGLDLASAQVLAVVRANAPFTSLETVKARLGATAAAQITADRHSVRTNHFEIRVRLRLDALRVEERATVVRNGLDVRVLWRDRVPWPGS